MVPCNLRWSYSNLDPLELIFPYEVRFPEDKALLTWESFTGYTDKVKLVLPHPAHVETPSSV